MTTAICFDLDGTLVRFSTPYGEIVEDALSAHLDAATEPLVDRYVDAFLQAFNALEPGPIHRGMAAVCDHADAERGGADETITPSTLADELRTREVAATELAPSAGALVETLAGDPQVVLGVVTNGLPGLQREKLRHVGLAEAFDAVVVSYEVGAHKPGPEPFEAARDRLDAERYVMVGDDLESDVRGAIAAGFEGIHVDGRVEVPTVGELSSIRLLSSSLG